MKKQGFTIVELMVTISIIVLMAVIAIPTFYSYEKRAELSQKTSELASTMVNLSVLTKNSPPGVAGYLMKPDANNWQVITIWSGVDPAPMPGQPAQPTTVKSDIIIPSSLKWTSMDGKQYLTCSVKQGSCCFSASATFTKTDAENACLNNNSNVADKFEISSDSIDNKAVISVREKPFDAFYK